MFGIKLASTKCVGESDEKDCSGNCGPEARRRTRRSGAGVKKIGDVLWTHLNAVLGKDEAKEICEDLAMVLANHHLVHSPDLCKALFYHMISVTEDWNSV